MDSPFYYFNSTALTHRAKNYSSRTFKLYYSVKACWFKGLVSLLDPLVDGFSVSSLSELHHTRGETNKPIHFLSPLLREKEIEAINHRAGSVAFNSLEQLKRLRHKVAPHVKIFLRVNPELSFIEDKRYDPCRPHSKLGIPVGDIKKYVETTHDPSLVGLHFHNACQDDDIHHAIQTLNKIKQALGRAFVPFQSINMGGGYVFSPHNFTLLQKESTRGERHIIIEPGFDLVNSAGYLASRVVDLFERQDKKIAVLDVSTNHLPEVFEYNAPPEVLGGREVKQGDYILAGASCLAGDVFGEYRFNTPVTTGSRVVFKNVGAYSLVKAHTFNGLEVPEVLCGSFNIQDLLNTRQKTGHYLSPDLTL